MSNGSLAVSAMTFSIFQVRILFFKALNCRETKGMTISGVMMEMIFSMEVRVRISLQVGVGMISL